MRFEGENIMNVLPYLFVENQDNISFITEKQPLEKLKQAFVKQMKDNKYTKFCEAMHNSVQADSINVSEHHTIVPKTQPKQEILFTSSLQTKLSPNIHQSEASYTLNILEMIRHLHDVNNQYTSKKK
eukprot:515766_1